MRPHRHRAAHCPQRITRRVSRLALYLPRQLRSPPSPCLLFLVICTPLAWISCPGGRIRMHQVVPRGRSPLRSHKLSRINQITTLRHHPSHPLSILYRNQLSIIAVCHNRQPRRTQCHLWHHGWPPLLSYLPHRNPLNRVGRLIVQQSRSRKTTGEISIPSRDGWSHPYHDSSSISTGTLPTGRTLVASTTVLQSNPSSCVGMLSTSISRPRIPLKIK